MLNRNYRYILKMCFTGMFVLISVKVQALEDLSIRENIHQQQRLDDLTKQFTHDGILKPKQKVEKRSLTTLVEHEAHCFQINQLKFIINDPLLLNNTSKLNDLFYALNQKNIVVGQCIGTQSLKNIIRYAQGELIKKGYVTSQLIVNDQDLSRGELVLNLQLGRVHQIYSKDAALSKSEIYTAFPIKRGDILDIKRIDQGLENLRKNLSRDVDIKIEPAVTQNGEKLVGYSDLFIISHLDKKIGINIGVDNSGYKNTGVYIGNLGISINSPLHLNDVLNLNLSHSLDNWHKDLNQNNYMSYVVPFKNYELSANYNEYTFEQNLPSYLASPIRYIGETQQSNVKLSKLLNRSTNYKTNVYIKGYHKSTRNSFGGIDLVSQQRTTTGWNLGFQHRHYIGTGVLDFDLNYRHGTGAFAATSAPEENIYFGSIHLPIEGYARAPLWSIDLSYTQPFIMKSSPVQYRLNLHGQYATQLLVDPDRFYIGGRYNVRGFDGENALSGDHGYYLQQELSVGSVFPATQLYVGLDQGWVKGRTNINNQNYLIGSVIGTRSFYKGIYLETFIGHGLSAPDLIKKQWVSGFNINFSY